MSADNSDPLGGTSVEKWFVECKHYVKGVPPDKMLGILTWATAARPDHALIIASNFLSNPTKDFLEDFKKNNNPPFRITYWERPQLEKAVVGRAGLLTKYRIADEFLFVDYLHPAHKLYLRSWQPNTIDYLLKTLDELDSEKRDRAMGWTYFHLVAPRLRKAVDGNETIGQRLIDEVSYESFKEKCRSLKDIISERPS